MISNNDFKAIADLDLDPIKVKLMHKESGEGWTLEYANQMEFEYRRFLYLMKMFPNEQTAPLFDVDIFWHYHILDTMKYAVDCEQVFGYFLHHFPYVGLRGEEDEAAHQRVGAHMRQLYEDTFEEPYIRANQQPAVSAWSTAVGKAAWSTAVARTAWSTAVAKTAWSTAVAKTAWSTAVPTAESSPEAKSAWSTAVPQTRVAAPGLAAWSTAVGATAWSTAVASPAVDSPAARAVDRFYSERPMLAAA